MTDLVTALIGDAVDNAIEKKTREIAINLLKEGIGISSIVKIMTMTPGHQQGMKHVGDGRLFFFLEKKYT